LTIVKYRVKVQGSEVRDRVSGGRDRVSGVRDRVPGEIKFKAEN
jgi:hypothetical protein